MTNIYYKEKTLSVAASKREIWLPWCYSNLLDTRKALEESESEMAALYSAAMQEIQDLKAGMEMVSVKDYEEKIRRVEGIYWGLQGIYHRVTKTRVTFNKDKGFEKMYT